MTLRQELDQRLLDDTDIRDHLGYLYQRTVQLGHQLGRPLMLIELGVRFGYSTCAFLAALEAVPGFLYSVDRNPAGVPDHWLRSIDWDFLQADDLSDQALQRAPRICDLLFIDTIHDYEHTLSELRAYGPRVRVNGGLILMHDTELAGHYPEFPQPQPDFPVAAALDTWCEESGLKWENRPGCFGLGIVEVPSRG